MWALAYAMRGRACCTCSAQGMVCDRTSLCASDRSITTCPRCRCGRPHGTCREPACHASRCAFFSGVGLRPCWPSHQAKQSGVAFSTAFMALSHSTGGQSAHAWPWSLVLRAEWHFGAGGDPIRGASQPAAAVLHSGWVRQGQRAQHTNRSKLQWGKQALAAFGSYPLGHRRSTHRLWFEGLLPSHSSINYFASCCPPTLQLAPCGHWACCTGRAAGPSTHTGRVGGAGRRCNRAGGCGADDALWFLLPLSLHLVGCSLAATC